jgi:hypothetical protein
MMIEWEERERERECIIVYVCFFGGQICVCSQNGNPHPYEDVTKFGYKLNCEIKNFKTVLLYFGYLRFKNKIG